MRESENRTLMNMLIVPTYVVFSSSCTTVVLSHVLTPFITALIKTLWKRQTRLQEQGRG